MKRRYTLLLAVLLACGLAAPQTPAHAQGGLQISVQEPKYTFGDPITFGIVAQDSAVITEVTFLHRPVGETTARSSKVTYSTLSQTARFVLDPQQQRLAPFAVLEYWWQVRDAAGNELTTEPRQFEYSDNRFQWLARSDKALTVHWYTGDDRFGEAALEIAAAALSNIGQALDVEPPTAIDIFIYASDDDARPVLQAALAPLWAGGHADPALGVVVVVAAPDLEMPVTLERSLPHELAHLLIHSATGPNYALVPAWLNEGLATDFEDPPDPAQPDTLAAAWKNRTLPSLAGLCGPFPPEPARARLAYAESASVVRHIRERFGAAGLAALLRAYAAGLGCGDGVQQALGRPLAQLEAEWLAETMQSNPVSVRLRALAPWLLLGGLTLTAPALAGLLALRKRRDRMV